ncbi:MAG: DUF481 domain-containing protein [Ectothiorhodospiraceae bacterium]|nr:DUF481 domain-containing protein [Ectothiorhodospiraceae bacterium]
MKFKYQRNSVIAIMLAASGIVSAEDKLNEWTGNVELGFVNTTGNTETQIINAKAKAQLDQEKWRHTAIYESLNSSNNDSTTAERYVLNGQSDYKFSEFNYFFIMVNYENDRFGGYDYRISETLGYGRRVLHRETLTLDLEVGPGARQSKLSDNGSENEVTVRGAAKVAWKITGYSRLTEDLSADVGEDATVIKSVTALTAQINGSLATKVTYTIKNTSEVPDGVKKTDTETAVTLVYSF